ncbi:protein-tyrosine phosphatase family protein [Metabacillus indicus]|uniref:Protein tyrosine phosphatase n=1 Tax=Metabacillus indicus TaxID=246786 RepID=A0A084GIW0_METID|nr:dual specificity protein phosphatase family protein [Metabacillus indicus]KEZ47272.1 protein tyrosine phosphatase [Metabacillus indicus]
MQSKNYDELIKKRVYIGGAADASAAAENEQTDVVFDLRSESDDSSAAGYHRIHSPITDDKERQDESVKNSIHQVVHAYNEGKKIYFHCGGGSNRTGTVAIGTLLSLNMASSIEEAERTAKEVRPKIQVKPEMKETLKRLYPNA